MGYARGVEFQLLELPADNRPVVEHFFGYVEDPSTVRPADFSMHLLHDKADQGVTTTYLFQVWDEGTNDWKEVLKFRQPGVPTPTPMSDDVIAAELAGISELD